VRINVTIRRVRVTTVAVKIPSVCLQPYLSIMEGAWAVLSLCPIWLYHILPHHVINSTIFGKKLLNITCVVWFSLQFLSETFLIARRIQPDILIYVHKSSCQAYIFLVTLPSIKKLEFSRQIFEKKILDYSTKWNKIRPVGAELFHVYGKTDGHTDMTKLTVTLHNFAYSLKNKFGYIII